MVKIISKRQRVWMRNMTHDFTRRDDASSGFTFPVEEEMTDVAKKNYEYCKSHPELFIDEGVEDRGWWYTEPAHAVCNKCGRGVILDGDVQCECGQWYNSFGQELLPPQYWYDECICG